MTKRKQSARDLLAELVEASNKLGEYGVTCIADEEQSPIIDAFEEVVERAEAYLAKPRHVEERWAVLFKNEEPGYLDFSDLSGCQLHTRNEARHEADEYRKRNYKARAVRVRCEVIE